MNQQVLHGIIIGSCLLLLVSCCLVIICILHRKYRLNWFHKNVLDLASESKEEQIDPLLSNSKEQQGEDNCNTRPTKLMTSLTRSVSWVQPTNKVKVVHYSTSSTHLNINVMGGEESRPVSAGSSTKKEIDVGKHRNFERIKPEWYRRFSEPAKDQRQSNHQSQLLSDTGIKHKALSATQSCPAAPHPQFEEDDKMEEIPRPSRQRRKASMQAAIDFSLIDPSLYCQANITETPSVIREETSVDLNEPIGLVHLNILYTTDTGLLKVTLRKAELSGFITDVQLRHPYFSVSVTGCQTTERQTKPSDNAINPSIDETFLFEVGDELFGKRLMLALYDHNQFIKSDQIGITQIRLSSLRPDQSQEIKKHIDRFSEEDEHNHDESYVGQLLFSASYHKATERLHFVISKAQDLHIEDELAVLGLMVKVTLCHQGHKLKKKRSENARISTSPTWQQAISFPVPAHLISELTITIDVCKDRLSSSEVIGRVTLGSDSQGRREIEHWNDMLQDHQSQLEWWHHLTSLHT